MSVFRLLSVIILFLACKPSSARLPVQQNSGSFIDTSIQINKSRNEREYKLIKQLVDKDNTFIASDYGFWYKYNFKNDKELYTPKFGDQVIYTYSIKNLFGEWIYSMNETNLKTYFVDQEELFSGLREGIKLMRKGEKITFIFPSQMAYGYYGDDNKIDANTPLICEVIVLDIIKN